MEGMEMIYQQAIRGKTAGKILPYPGSENVVRRRLQGATFFGAGSVKLEAEGGKKIKSIQFNINSDREVSWTIEWQNQGGQGNDENRGI